jgi:hypothetical protein
MFFHHVDVSALACISYVTLPKVFIVMEFA